MLLLGLLLAVTQPLVVEARDYTAISIHLTPASYSGCSTVDVTTMDCGDLVTAGDSSVAQFAFVVASGFDAIAGLQFGVEYDSTVAVSDWQLCTGGLQIPDETWPASGSNLALTWPDTQYPTTADSLVLVGYFTIPIGATGTISVMPDDRTGRAEYVDGAGLQRSIDAMNLGSSSGSVDGGWAGYTACGEEIPAPPPSSEATGVQVILEAGIVNFGTGVSAGSIEDANLASAAVETTLVNHDVVEIAMLIPGFEAADTLLTSRFNTTFRGIDYRYHYVLSLAPTASTADHQALMEDLDPLDEVRMAMVDVAPIALGEDPYTCSVGTNDTMLHCQWGVHNHGQEVFCDGSHSYDAVAGVDINAPEAWALHDTVSTLNTIRVVVLDVSSTGVAEHRDLAGRVEVLNPRDNGDHGLNVAAMVGAEGCNGFGVAGMDWRAEIKMDTYGGGASSAERMKAWDPTYEVSNHSWGWGSSGGLGPFRDLFLAGQVVVAASGNDDCELSGPDSWYPAAARSIPIISVGAIDFRNQYFEEGGPDGPDNDWGPWCHGSTLDMVAPAREIWTLATTSTSFADSVMRTSGTSVAAPMVAGLASMMLAERLDLYPYDVLNLIRFGATDVYVDGQDPMTGFDIYTGYGRVDAARTLGFLRPPRYLLHATHVGGAIDSSETTDLFRVLVFGWAGGEDEGSEYWVRRQTVVAPTDWAVGGVIDYPTGVDFGGYHSVPKAWGRAMDASGFTSGVAVGEQYQQLTPRILTVPFCDVVPGSVTQTGLQLYTYRYEVFEDAEGTQPVGVIPSDLDVSEWTFHYSAVGDTVEVVGVPDVLGRPWAIGIEGPQPSRSPATLVLDLPDRASVLVDVFDPTGRHVAALHDGPLSSGRHLIRWDGLTRGGQTAAPGVYFIRARSSAYPPLRAKIVLTR